MSRVCFRDALEDAVDHCLGPRPELDQVGLGRAIIYEHPMDVGVDDTHQRGDGLGEVWHAALFVDVLTLPVLEDVAPGCVDVHAGEGAGHAIIMAPILPTSLQHRHAEHREHGCRQAGELPPLLHADRGLRVGLFRSWSLLDFQRVSLLRYLLGGVSLTPRGKEKRGAVMAPRSMEVGTTQASTIPHAAAARQRQVQPLAAAPARPGSVPCSCR